LIHLPIGRLYSPRTALQGMRFVRLLHRAAIQVVHTHDLYTNIFAAPWARLGGCRVMASRRWLDTAPRPGLRPLNRWSYRFADRVLTNSALVGKTVVATEGVPASKVIELPNFLEERAFRHVDAETRNAQRLQWGVPHGAFIAGAVARLAPVKNHEMLIRALPLLAADVHVVLIGDGPSRQALEGLARQLRVESRVHFAGQVVGAINLHQFLDVSVLCSRSEGFPNSIIEALAAQCPVIATPVGGVPEVIADGQTGLLVPVDDWQALARRLQELRSDATLRARLTAGGLAAVRIKYHQSVVIAQLESLYQELARDTLKGSAIPS
jgi:glycosyltransferase involved in cell wall biosynthesis